MPLKRSQIAWRAAQDLADGAYVNLGIGLPTLVADFIPEDRAPGLPRPHPSRHTGDGRCLWAAWVPASAGMTGEVPVVSAKAGVQRSEIGMAGPHLKHGTESIRQCD